MTNDIRTGILFLASKAGLKPEALENEKSYKELNAAHRKLDKINGVGGDENHQSSPGASITKEPVLDPPDSKSPRLADEHKELQRIELPKHPEIKTLYPGSQATQDGVMYEFHDPEIEGKLREAFKQMSPETERALRLDPTALAMMYQESKLNPNAVSPTGAEGMFQIIKSTGRNPGYGITPVEVRKDNLDEQANFFLNYKKVGYDSDHLYDERMKIQAYNSGRDGTESAVARAREENDEKNWTDYIDVRYADKKFADRIINIRDNMLRPIPEPYDVSGDSMKPLPEEHNKRLKEQQQYEAKITFDGTFNLNSPDGKPAAFPVNAQKIVSLPIPFGAR